MEEQQALFETVQLADGTEATAAEAKLIDAITQEAKKYREEIIKRLIQFSPQIAPELAKTTEELPIRYKFFLNSKTGIQLIRLLGGADLALELIQAKPQTPKRKIYPLGQIQQFFWILYYVTANTPPKMLPQTTDIIGDALTELHFNKAKNPWTKVCFKATNTKLYDAIITIIDANFEKIMAEKKANPELLQAVEQYHETLHKLLLDFKTASTVTPKKAAGITAKAIFTHDLMNKAAGALPAKNTDGSYPKFLSLTGTARKEEWKKNKTTGKKFLAPEINDKIVLMIPKEAKIEAATPDDFFTFNDREIVSYVTGEILKCRSGKRPPDAISADKLPLIAITPTEIYRALYRNPNALPQPETLKKIDDAMDKLHSRLQCRIDNDAEDKITGKATSTKSFKPILPYHDKKQLKRADGRTYTIYYFGLYLSAFAGYAIEKNYYTTLDINETLIYKLDANGKISVDKQGNPTTQLEKMGETRRKLASFFEIRVLNYNLASRKIIIDNMLEELGISDRKERSRIIAFIPTILENLKRYGKITSYKITDDEIKYSIPHDAKKKELPATKPSKE